MRTITRALVGTILLLALLRLAATAHGEAGSGETAIKRLAVATPQYARAQPSDDRLACAAYVLADGLTDALAGRVGEWTLLDRMLVRTLEREQAPLGAELEIRFAITVAAPGGGATARGIEVRVTSPAALAGRTFTGDDPARLLPELADAIIAALALPATPRRPFVAFPSAPAVCARLALAQQLFDPADAGALASARKELEAALRSAPEDARVLAALAEVHIRTGALDKGIALAGRALEAAPQSAEAHWALGLAHDYAGRVELASSAYRAALLPSAGILAARVNAGLLALRAGELRQALTLLEEAAQRAPTWFVAQFDLAIARLDAGDGRGALRALGRLQAPSRFAPERALLEAAALLQLGDAAKATQLAEPLRTHAAVGARARALLARARAMGGDHAGALAALDAALAETDTAPASLRERQSLLVARARVLSSAGKKNEAIEALRSLTLADAELTMPLLRRALVALGGAGQESLEAIVARRPNDHESWYDLGVLRQRAGDLTGAAEAYERAAQHNPRAAWALYNRGLVALDRGAPEEALTWLEAAQRIDDEAADIAAALVAARARSSGAPAAP